MIHPNDQPDGLHQTSPTTHTLIRNGRPTHTVETHNQPTEAT